MFDYQKICQILLKDLSQREKEIIKLRFGLEGGEKTTLESLGKKFGLTRERVRQIEEGALKTIKPKIAQQKELLQHFRGYLKKAGGLKKEETLLADLAGHKEQAEVKFLLETSGLFKKFKENRDFYSFWALDCNTLNLAKKTITLLSDKLKEIGRPLSFKELSSLAKKSQVFLLNCLEVSKKILVTKEGFYGLKDWPEINPRGVKDKAYLVFQELKKPLHFSEVAKLIAGAQVPTVHNELIRDPRFVLVGRGIYALKEWGYEPGEVKDIIKKILKENGPLTQKEILERVQKQRLVKEKTILLSLANKNYFSKDPKGRYIVKEI